MPGRRLCRLVVCVIALVWLALFESGPGAAAADAKTSAITISQAAHDRIAAAFANFDAILARARSEHFEVVDEVGMLRGAIEALRKTFPLAHPRVDAAIGPDEPLDTAAVLTASAQILDAGVATEDQLFSVAVNGAISTLGPNSVYLNATAFRDLQISVRAEFGYVGLDLTIDRAGPTVMTPLDGAASARAGIRTGDVISHIDGVPLAGLSIYQIVDRHRGPLNSEVRLRIVRPGRAQPFDVTLTRERLNRRAAEWRVENETLGYVRIRFFSIGTSAAETFRTAIAELTEKIGRDRLSGFVLDFRNGSGAGFSRDAIQLADAMLEKGEIVSTHWRNAVERLYASAGDVTGGRPLAVLINGGTTAGFEIIAAALRDNKRATLVGSRSFGSGLVPSMIPLGQGRGALRLMTARCLTPSGRSIEVSASVPTSRSCRMSRLIPFRSLVDRPCSLISRPKPRTTRPCSALSRCSLNKRPRVRSPVA